MPEITSAQSLRDHFATLPDPRIDRTKRYLLIDSLFLPLTALLAGAEECVSIADFVRTNWTNTLRLALRQVNCPEEL